MNNIEEDKEDDDMEDSIEEDLKEDLEEDSDGSHAWLAFFCSNLALW